jgi:hypothetical protein
MITRDDKGRATVYEKWLLDERAELVFPKLIWTNLKVQPSPFDKLRAGSAGLILQSMVLTQTL